MPPSHEASTWAPRQARNSLQQWTHVRGGTTTPPGPVATPTSGTGRTHMAWNGTGSLEATRPGRHLFGCPPLPTHCKLPCAAARLGCCRWDAWSSRAEARPRVPGVDPQPLRALPLLHHHAWKNTTSSLTSPPRPLFVNRSATGRGAEFRQWIVHCLSP